jgi:hypothetical protein
VRKGNEVRGKNIRERQQEWRKGPEEIAWMWYKNMKQKGKKWK